MVNVTTFEEKLVSLGSKIQEELKKIQEAEFYSKQLIDQINQIDQLDYDFRTLMTTLRNFCILSKQLVEVPKKEEENAGNIPNNVGE